LSCESSIVNIATFISRDAKNFKVNVPIEKKKMFVSQDEYEALTSPFGMGPVTGYFLRAIDDQVDVIVATSALMRCLRYMQEGGLQRFFLKATGIENVEIKNFVVYKTKSSQFAVLVAKHALKKFVSLQHMGIRKESLQKISSNIKEIYKFFREKNYDPIIDDFSSIFIKSSSPQKIVYLMGHGFYCKSIANLPLDDYQKVLETLQSIGCQLLYVDSCFAGGKSAIKVHSRMKKITFPVFYGSFSDAAAKTSKNMRFAGFYESLREYFSVDKSKREPLVQSSHIKNGIRFLSGLNLLIPSFIVDIFLQMRTDMLAFVGYISNFLFMDPYHLSKILIGSFVGGAALALHYYIQRRYIQEAREGLSGIVSFFLPHDLDNTDGTLFKYPRQSVIVLDASAKVVYPRALFEKLYKDTEREKSEKNKEFFKKPILVRNRDTLLIYPLLTRRPIAIKGAKMPKVYSMIHGKAHHYINKIYAKNFKLDDFIKGFIDLEFAVFSPKLFVIGGLACKNFDNSGILYPNESHKDNASQDLVITNLFIFKPAKAKSYADIQWCGFTKRDDKPVIIESLSVKEARKKEDTQKSIQEYFLKIIDDTSADISSVQKSGNMPAKAKKVLAILKKRAERF